MITGSVPLDFRPGFLVDNERFAKEVLIYLIVVSGFSRSLDGGVADYSGNGAGKSLCFDCMQGFFEEVTHVG